MLSGIAAALDSVTVKLASVLPVVGSVTDASLMLKLGGAVPSATVAVALARLMPALLGVVSARPKLSVPSTSSSAFTATLTVLVVSPAAKVSVPDAAA